jgi:hypothetical protein
VGEKGILKETGQQLISGMDDVTSLLALPFEAFLPSIVFGDQGVELLMPSETMARREAGLLGLPGRAQGPPTGIFGSAARFAGATLAAGPILGRAFGFVKPSPVPATTKLGKVAQFPRKVAAGAGERFAAHPVTSTLVEAGFGASAGVGGFFARQLFPDSDAAQLGGEILGGTLPALTPTGLMIRAAGGLRNAVNFVRAPLTEIGGRRRAAARAQRAAPPEQRREAITELDRPTTLDPETGQPVLTPAQRTGDPGLLSLERSVVESSETLMREADAQIAHANAAIQQSLLRVGDQPPGAVTATLEESSRYLDTLLDTRLRVAAQRTDERLAQMGSGASREAANRTAREELTAALRAARNQETELYRLVPENTPVPYRQASARLEAFKTELGKAQRSDIPAIARRFLDRESGEFLGRSGEKIVRTTTIKEMRAVQSKLREVARNARAGEKRNLNRARIADDIANAITDDIAHASDPAVAEAVQLAVEFSRGLNERFSRGAVGKVLQRGAAGGEKVPPGLTLEASMGVTGPRAREALDDILKAFDSPEAPSSAVVIGASEDYLRGRFLATAVEQGKLNARSAERFLRDNEEVLKRLPRVRREIEETIDAGNKMAVAERHRARIDLDDPRVSKATMLIEKGPVETFRQISRMKIGDAQRETQLLINRAQRDATGEALEGLKSGFVEYLLAGARSRARDVRGTPFVSGFALRDALAAPGARAAANRMFTPDELNRLGIITRDLIRLEKRLGTPISAEGIIGDRPSKVIETVAGIAGAAVGRSQARRMGIGGTVQIPGILANRFRELVAAGVKDPASRLMRDAMLDEDLFRELLEAPLEDGGRRLGKVARGRLNIWAAGVLAEHGAAPGTDEEDEAQ